VVGGRYFCRRALITLVMPLHRPGGANAAASVCLYRKQERSLRCRPIDRPRLTVGLWSPVPRGRSAIAFPACVSTRAPHYWRHGRCPPFHVPISPRCRPIVQQRPTAAGSNSPIHCPGADRPLRFPSRAPRVARSRPGNCDF